MVKIVGHIEAPPQESLHDILWSNLKIADSQLNLELFIMASQAWLKLNPTETYQKLEKELRERNLQTYICAGINKAALGMKLTPINKLNYTPEYEAIFSCRPPPYALQEVLQTSSTYEENFAKLAKAGVYVMSKDDTHTLEDFKEKTDEDIKIFNDKERDFAQLLSDNKIKLTIKEIDDKTFINEIAAEIMWKTGKKVTSAVYGVTMNGNPIFCLTIDEKIVCNYGFSICYQDDKEVFRVMELDKF